MTHQYCTTSQETSYNDSSQYHTQKIKNDLNSNAWLKKISFKKNMKYLTQLFFTILVLSDALYLPSCVFFSIYVVISFMYLDHALALCMAKSTPACNLSKMESISSGFIAVKYQKKYHSCMYHWASIQSIQFFLCKTLQQCKFASRILFPSFSAKTF